ncbi:MAG: hypothetical protein IKZ12_03435 [Alistipes sp.]|nr:hypothetical protein [Alistipes sp.]
MRNEQEIRALLARYDEGLATAEEELRLRDLLADVEALPADLQAAATLFEGFAALREEQMPPRHSIVRAGRRWWGWAVAAAAVVGLFWVVDRTATPYCYIDGVAVYDSERALASTECLAYLEHLDRTMELFDQLIQTETNE